jgi:hypothetical protein
LMAKANAVRASSAVDALTGDHPKDIASAKAIWETRRWVFAM